MLTIKVNNRVKHINLKINFIREMILRGFVVLHFVPTAYNVADIFTKPLDPPTFERLRDVLMNGHGGVEPCFDTHTVLNATALLNFDSL